MLKLKKNKKKRQEEAAAAAAAAAASQGSSEDSSAAHQKIGGLMEVESGRAGKKKGGKPPKKKIKPVELRLQQDITELDSGKVAKVTFPDPNNLTDIRVTIKPDSGLWRGATYPFTINVPENYPHKPPVCHCHEKIWHPNIDLQGNVCLNILREDWRPVLDINAVIYGLIYLFYEPNANDPLNHEAAEQLRSNESEFRRQVNASLRGGTLRMGKTSITFTKMGR